jgi:hypothetical protein
MGTSTNRPKPKAGPSAAKNGSGKPDGTQPTTNAAKSTNGTQPATSKTPTSKTATQPTTAKTTGKVTPAVSKPTPAFVGKRDQKREDMSRKIEERRLQREREQRNRTLKRWAIFGIPSAVIVIVIGILIYNALFGPGVAAYLKGETIDGVECNSTEMLNSHYHAHLQIYINGQEAPIPTDVGRQTPTCYYWLHTHPIQNDDGVIHIESPDSRTYTLHQFFDIWGKTFTSTNLLDKPINDTHQLTVYVYNPDSQPTDQNQPFTVTPPSDLQPYTGDPTQIVLKPHELIVLEYGTPTVTPQPFTFIAGE